MTNKIKSRIEYKKRIYKASHLFFLLIIILIVAGCLNKPLSEPTSSLKESDVWYKFRDLLTPGYYLNKGANDIYNNLVDIKSTLKGIIPGFSDLDDIQSVSGSIDSASSAGFIESNLLEAGGKCGKVSISDTNEKLELYKALNHFGDLYGDDNPNTNPAIDDLKNTKELAECFLDKYGTKSPEGKYLSQVTSALIKFLDSKISRSGQMMPTAMKVNLEEGELGYDDGEKDGASSLGSNDKIGHLVRFSAPNEGFIINKVKIYGYRFGDGNDFHGFGKSFDLEIWDSNLETIHKISSDYDEYFDKGKENIKWVEINTPELHVNHDFYVFFNTNSIKSPQAESGIDIGIDTDASTGRSSIALADKKILKDWSERKWSENSKPLPPNYNWMIRVSNK